MSKWMIFIVPFLFLIACTHNPPESERAVAEVSEEAAENLDAVIQTQDAENLRQKFVKLRIAQTLVSSFDARIAGLKTEVQGDQLYGSQLYCKLMDVRSIHDHTEEQLVSLMTTAQHSGAARWFYDQMAQFAKNDDPAHAAAIGNLFRLFADEEIKICGSKNCIKGNVALLKLKVNPLDNNSFNQFLKNNKTAIARYANLTANDLKAGDCFEKADGRTPQAVGYDWANRNWVGSVLPAGQFVFTYDDGPHVTYTQIIRDTWANAGMAKPAFFWLRQNVSRLPTIVKQLNDAGYVIGSHSERHADLGTLAKSNSAAGFNAVDREIFGKEVVGMNAEQFAAWKTKTLDREINQSITDLSTILGKKVRYFRLPFGSGTKNDLIGARFQALNLDHFFWRIDSLDWQDKNPDSIRDRVVGQMGVMKKGIVLFHDIHSQSAAAAQLMVNYLKTSTSYKAVPIQSIPGLQP